MTGKRSTYGDGTTFWSEARQKYISRAEAGFYPNGTRRRVEATGDSEAEAKRKRREKERALAANGGMATTTKTVRVWAEEWLNIVVRTQRPKPYSTSASAVNKWIIPILGKRRLDRLTRADLRRLQDAQRDAGNKPSSYRRTHATIIRMLKDAHAEGIPVPANVLTMPAPAPNASDRTHLPPVDLVAMLEQIVRADDPSRWIAVLFQGLRPAERLGLTWSCVDFDNDVLDISWQLQALPYLDRADKSRGFRVPDGYEAIHLCLAFHLVRPKSAAGQRFVPMTPWMRSALLEWRQHAPVSPYDLVWCRADGQPIRPAAALDEWKTMQEHAGIKHPHRDHFVLHEGRHTTATLLRELGVSDEVLISILGHASIASSRVYVHTNVAAAARAAMLGLHERIQLADPRLAAIEKGAA